MAGPSRISRPPGEITTASPRYTIYMLNPTHAGHRYHELVAQNITDYAINETIFWTSDYSNNDLEYTILEAKLTDEMNKAGQLEVTVPSTHAMLSQMNEYTTMFEITSNVGLWWCGRLIGMNQSFNNTVVLTFEGLFACLNDIGAMASYNDYLRVHGQPYDPPWVDDPNTGGWSDKERVDSTGEAAKIIRAGYNFECSWFRRFQDARSGNIGSMEYERKFIEFDTYKTKTEMDLFNDLVTSMHDVYYDFWIHVEAYIKKNGTMQIRLQKGFNPTGISINFGDTLLDINKDIDALNIATVMFPIGEWHEAVGNGQSGELLLDNDHYVVENTPAKDKYGRIWTIDSDTFNYFGDASNTSKNTMSTKARLYLKQPMYSKPHLEIKINTVNPAYLQNGSQDILVGDLVKCISIPHNINNDFVCTKAIYYLLSPSKNQYELTYDSDLM